MRAEWQSRASLHVHGCSCWEVDPDEGLADLAPKYLKCVIERRDDGEGGGHRSVSDDQYQDVQNKIFGFLGDVGFTARNPDVPTAGVAVTEEARARGLAELARDMRDFDWTDENACDERYSNLLTPASATQGAGGTA